MFEFIILVLSACLIGTGVGLLVQYATEKAARKHARPGECVHPGCREER